MISVPLVPFLPHLRHWRLFFQRCAQQECSLSMISKYSCTFFGAVLINSDFKDWNCVSLEEYAIDWNKSATVACEMPIFAAVTSRLKVRSVWN